jgi:hypothetical protein
MNLPLLYISLPIVAISPVFFLKKYVSNNQSDKKYIILALLGYLCLTYLYIKLLKIVEMTKLFCISQIIQILMIFIGSILIYAENITMNKIIGVIISICAIYFFSK